MAVRTMKTTKISVSDDVPKRLILIGAMDYEDAPTLRHAADTLLDDGAAPLRVDVRGMDFLDSSGLSALVHAAKKAADQGTYVCLLGAQNQLRHLLHVTKMQALFELEEALPLRACDPEPDLDFPPAETSFDLPCSPSALAQARERVGTLLNGRGFSPEERADVMLALGEAIANAIRHGCPRATTPGGIHVRAACDAEGLTLEVTDPGPGFDDALLPEPDVTLLKEGGMGVFFMRSVMDTVAYRHDEDGNTVTMTKQRAVGGGQ